MKKEIFALALLLALFAGGAYNTSYLNGFTSEICDILTVSESSLNAGDSDRALELAELAHDDWHSHDGYTGVFIRHTEIDAVTYGFHELISALESDEPQNAGELYSGMIEHVRSLYEMERITLRNVF